ncbi:MAG: hypothetical protein ACK4ON_09515 [Bacteroidia bacterium]
MIRLANYHTHPEHKDYTVFTFKNFEQGNYFESELIAQNIPYEKAIDEDEKVMMFGIKSALFEQAQKINADSFAKYKKAFIPDDAVRYTLLIIFFILMALALTGYIKTHYLNE